MAQQPISRLARFAFLTYGILCYSYFLACFLYSIAFIGNFDIVPKTMDSGESGPLGATLIINIGLLSLFAVQHSVMARPGFKVLWTKFVPKAAERSTYVLLSTVCLTLLYIFWQPMGATVWDISNQFTAIALNGLYLFGWAFLLLSTAQLDHFDLFGVRQSWLAFRGKAYVDYPFSTPGLYKHMRHPIYVGWAIIFWATPTMSAGHLIFAAVTTVYMIVAVFLEERDLVDHFGDAYRRYQESTPKFLAGLPRRKARSEVIHPSTTTV